MKQQDNTHIIGVDHGYGNIKTANFCFPSGVVCFDSPPMLAQDLRPTTANTMTMCRGLCGCTLQAAVDA